MGDQHNLLTQQLAGDFIDSARDAPQRNQRVAAARRRVGGRCVRQSCVLAKLALHIPAASALKVAKATLAQTLAVYRGAPDTLATACADMGTLQVAAVDGGNARPPVRDRLARPARC